MFTHYCIVCNKKISFFDAKVRYGGHFAHVDCTSGGIKCYVES